MSNKVIVIILLLGILSLCSSGFADGEPGESIIGYWNFDEGSGTVAHDCSIYQNHGEVHNATWITGVIGQALYFNGTDDSYVEVPNKPELTPTRKLLIEVWIKPESYPTWHMAIVYKGDLEQTGCFGERSYSLWARSDGRIHFTWTPEGENCQLNYYTEADLIPLDQWSHVKVDLDTLIGKVLIFINDSKVFESNCPCEPIKKGNSPLRIGGMFRSLGDQSNFKGCIDEVMIWGNELPPPLVASFTYSPSLEEFLSGQEITFIACENETIISYEWSFRHGTTEIGTDEGPVVHNRFTGIPNGATDYKIILTVRDAIGRVGVVEKVITVTHLEKKVEVVVDDILATGLSRIGARASYNWVGSEGSRDIFKISRIDSWSHYFVGVYVVNVENDSGILWEKPKKDLPAIPPDRTYYPESLYVHASDWLRVTAYGVTEKEMLGLVSIAAGLVGLPTLPPGDVPFFYGSDMLYLAPDYIDTSDFPPIDVEDTEILPLLMGRLCSPGELRIYDSQGRVTGLLNGQIKEEIPDSVYFNGYFVILFPSDLYRYEIVGLEPATYDLPVISVETDKLSAFGAADIPTSPNAVHQYAMDWEALSAGEAGATIKIDAEGDGVFERTIVSNNKLTPCKIAIEPIGYELISQESISDTEFEYTFQILAKNSATQDIKDVTFKLAEPPNNVSVIDGIAYFSFIEPGEEILSDDSVKVCSNKSFEVLKSELVWQICNCFQRLRSDFNRDWYVDLPDLAEFAEQWLQPCSDPNWCQGIDLDRSTIVNFTDFAIFAKDWLWKIKFTGLDIDNDVDLTDYALFADYWMNKNCAELAWCYGIDFNKNGQVDFHDLRIFAEHWLEGIVP
jgi:hypothetical protein